MSQVPAATRALRVLRFLATQPDPVGLGRIVSACGLPRSTAYHLLNAMIDEGFVVHLPEEHRYGLGVAAFEVGSGYGRQVPLQRMARRALAALVDRCGESDIRGAHLAVLHGTDALYVLEERAPGRPPLVTDVDVRLPAHVTASGRAMLACLSIAQVRALYSSPDDFVERGRDGAVRSLATLRTELVDTRRRGHGVERGEVTAGLTSVAVAVLDHTGHPVAAVAVTFEGVGAAQEAELAHQAGRTASLLTERIGGRPRG